MSNVQKVGFNLLEYAKLNNLKLTASAKLKDGSSLKFFAGDNNRVDCFLLDKNRKIAGAKGAMGSVESVRETISNIIEKVKDNIVSVSKYVK